MNGASAHEEGMDYEQHVETNNNYMQSECVTEALVVYNSPGTVTNCLKRILQVGHVQHCTDFLLHIRHVLSPPDLILCPLLDVVLYFHLLGML